jgi:hypothetical protein
MYIWHIRDIINRHKIYGLAIYRIAIIVYLLSLFISTASAATDKTFYLPISIGGVEGGVVPIYPSLEGGHELIWTDVFQAPGDFAQQWVLGDGALSVPIGDYFYNGTWRRQILWIFGDSLTGTCGPGGTLAARVPDLWGNSVAVQEYQCVGIDCRSRPGTPGEIVYRDWGAKFPPPPPLPPDDLVREANDSWIPIALSAASSPVLSRHWSRTLADAIDTSESHPNGGYYKIRMWVNGNGTMINNNLVLFFTPITSYPGLAKAHETVAVVIPSAGPPTTDTSEKFGHEEFSPQWNSMPDQRVLDNSDVYSGDDWAENIPEATHGNWWGHAVLKDAYYYYIYGKYDQKYDDNKRGVVLARIPVSLVNNTPDNFLNTALWEYYNVNAVGHWDLNHNPDNATLIINFNVEFPGTEIEYNQFSVFYSKKLSKYVLVTNAGSLLYPGDPAHPTKILIKTSNSPEGPWVKKYVFNMTDCHGLDDSELIPNIPDNTTWWWYGDMMRAITGHEEHSDGNSLLVSYVATGPKPDLEEEVPCYYGVPRFVRIPWAEIRDWSESSPARCAKWHL